MPTTMPDFYSNVNQMAALQSSLPRVVLPPTQRAAPNLANPRLAATAQGKPRKSAPPYVDVVGQPSMQIAKIGSHSQSGNGVVVSIRRNSRFTEAISDSDLREVEAIANQMHKAQIAASKGPISYVQLREKGHPYGYGRRRGLGRMGNPRGTSNLSVVNTHSGEFAGAWEVEVVRDKAGVTLLLRNTSRKAAWLAFGTPKMRAHGPFTTAPARFLFALNVAWARAARRGWYQQNALAGFASS